MADLVLVTGISGFVGGHVALQLLEAGYRVRGSVRSPDRSAKVRDTLARAGADVSRLEFVALDLLRDAGWTEAMADVRYLQHVASPFVTGRPKDRNELIEPAVEGTRRALEAAFAATVERVVLTSSMAAIVYGHPAGHSGPFDARDWTDVTGEGVSAYVESKTLAERKAWEIAASHGRTGDLVVINPGMIYGPLLDEDPGTSGTLIIDMLRGKMPMVPRVGPEAIDIRDVAAVHVKAMTAPEAGGQRFPMGTGPLSLMQMGTALKRAFPNYASRLPRGELPDGLVRLIAPLVPALRDNVGEIGEVRRIDSTTTRALLGRDFIGGDEMVVATGQTAIANGII